MARLRSIRPEFWSDSTIVKLDFFTRLLYIAMWNFADDHGRNRCLSKEIVGFAFPLDDEVSQADVERGIQTLNELGRIIIYEVDGIRCYQVIAWLKHQSVNRPTPSKFPPPLAHEPITEVLTEPITEGVMKASSAHVLGIRNQESVIRKQEEDNRAGAGMSSSSSFAQSASNAALPDPLPEPAERITLPPDEPLPPRKSPYRTNLTHESNYEPGAMVEDFMKEDKSFKPPTPVECEQWFHDKYGRKDIGTVWWEFWTKKGWKGFVDWKVNAEIDAPKWISRENQFAQEKAANQKPTLAVPTKKTTDDGLRIAEESGKIQAVPPPAEFLKLREKIGRSIPA